MQKQKLKLDQEDLQELLKMMRNYIEMTQYSENNFQIVVTSVLKSLVIKIITKMLNPKPNYSISLKEHEAYAVRQFLQSIKWSDPFRLSLTERILSVKIQ